MVPKGKSMSGQLENHRSSVPVPPVAARRDTKLVAKADTKLQTDKSPPAFRRPLRILVVDDNADVANTLCMLLQLFGHEVCTAYDGPDGLQLAETFGPEAILLDIRLPGMDGYEVARRLRQREEFRQVMLVAITGLATTADRQKALDAGFDHHLAKPFAPDDLLKVLARIS
jgi:CheY-like chemotaxis protein